MMGGRKRAEELHGKKREEKEVDKVQEGEEEEEY